MARNLPKDICACCAKFINIGQAITECLLCNFIVHTKCFGRSGMLYLNSFYYCKPCSKTIEERYNPFRILTDIDARMSEDSKFYDDDPNSLPDSIQFASNILNQCDAYSTQQVTSLYRSLQTQAFSSYFLNIDGNKTNFDHLVVELSMFNFDFSAIGLAETNTDSHHKLLYQITTMILFTRIL